MRRLKYHGLADPIMKVTIFKRTFGGNIPFVTIGVGVANKVHPVPRKAFAEVW